MDNQPSQVFTSSPGMVGARFVLANGALAGSAASAVGVSRNNPAANGGLFIVDKRGSVHVEAGAAIANGDELQSDASGRAIVRAGGPLLAKATSAAAGAGVLITADLMTALLP